jgi:hypothetical protein
MPSPCKWPSRLATTLIVTRIHSIVSTRHGTSASKDTPYQVGNTKTEEKNTPRRNRTMLESRILVTIRTSPWTYIHRSQIKHLNPAPLQTFSSPSPSPSPSKPKALSKPSSLRCNNPGSITCARSLTSKPTTTARKNTQTGSNPSLHPKKQPAPVTNARMCAWNLSVALLLR